MIYIYLFRFIFPVRDFKPIILLVKVLSGSAFLLSTFLKNRSESYLYDFLIIYMFTI